MARYESKAAQVGNPDGSKDGLVLRDYASFGEYLTALRTLPPESRQGSEEWAGAKNVGAALDLALHGWAEGANRVRTVALPAVQAVTSAHVQDAGWGWDVEGANYDVGEYLSGVPECWQTPRVAAMKPCVTVAANIVSSAGVSNEALEMRGAAVVALTLALQAGGYAVKVYAVEGMHVNGKDVWHRTLLSDAGGGPLDTDRLLFALAHVGNMRQAGYSLGVDLAGADPKGGAFIGWPREGHDAKPPVAWHADLYLKAPFYTDAQWADAASVQAWVTAQYERITKGGDAQAS